MKILLAFLLFIELTYARDDFTIDFIQSFINNQDKPTTLIFDTQCWSNYVKVKLINKMSKIGVKASGSTREKSKYQDQSLLYIADLECSGAKEVIRNASSRKLFGSPYRWLIFIDSILEMHPMLSILANCSIFPDSDVTIAEKINDAFRLKEIHKPAANETLLITPSGYYNETLVDIRSHKAIFRRRRNLMGHPLTMSNVIEDNNSTQYHLPREDRLELQHDAVSKLNWICAKNAFLMLNATPRYIFSYKWGSIENGKWTGMINDLNEGKADIGTNCAVVARRLDVVSYTDMVVPQRKRFIFRQPALPFVSNIFSLPFSNSVWAAMFVCVAASGAALYLASKWETRHGTSQSQLDGNIGDALLLTLSAVTQQGCAIEPQHAAGRIMEWILFTILMALYAAYSANIVVLLQSPSNYITNLPQLADAKIGLGANLIDYNNTVYDLLDDPVRERINKRLDPPDDSPQYFQIDEAVAKIRQGLFAFHSHTEPVYRRIQNTFHEKEKCDLMELDFLNVFDTFLPVKKDSPYLELFRVVFKQIRESGIRSALIERYQVPRPSCAGDQTAFSSVGLLDIEPVLTLMLYGVVLSIAILFFEIIVVRITKYCPLNKTQIEELRRKNKKSTAFQRVFYQRVT